MEKNQGTAAQATKQLEKQSAHFSKTKHTRRCSLSQAKSQETLEMLKMRQIRS